MIRQRKKIVSLDTVRELDTFPKLPETYVETSRVGGTCKFCSTVSLGFKAPQKHIKSYAMVHI